MMAHVSKQCDLGILYLSPLHVNEANITGFELLDDHKDLINLTKREREKYCKKALDTEKLKVGKYILGVMKKVRRDGCILAAIHYGLVENMSVYGISG